jgi:peroxiredoxin
MVDVGQPAPDFTLRAHEGDPVTLSQFKGDKYVVLSIYPAAFTGG